MFEDFSMQRIQVFLHEEQYLALKKLAHLSGVAQSDLIRQGVDLLLKSKKQKQQSWKQAANQLVGIWQDHHDLAETQQTIRRALNTRMAGLSRE